MNVVYVSDNAYAKYLGISMLSLLDHNQDMEEITVYVLSKEIKSDNILRLRKIAEKYRRTVKFIDIEGSDRLIPYALDTSGYNPIILSRLFLGRYLPEEIECILYLDCDIIINGSIKELETISLGRNLIAAVPELYMPTEKKALLGLQKEETYYNSGVLLINLTLWRCEKIEKDFMKYCHLMNGKLLYIDQDILNHCCKGRILTLSHTYNLSTNLFYFPRYFMKRLQPAYDTSSAKKYARILSSPAIIHYAGDERPWIAGNRNKYRRQYEYYYRKSPWRKEPLIQGQRFYMFCYHILNIITFICPWFRIMFSKLIGINIYKWFSKK